ncbi:hypothetical protein AGMMS49525_16830 [Bacteroidia bacterium]|nr:hypothetical protein AGMMS49525_16830 [Bacteroidia bacterium]
MKMINFKTVFVVALLCLGSTTAMAQSRNDRNRQEREKREIEHEKNRKTVTLPCMMYDDAEWYVASGVSRINMKDLNTTAINKLLSECQQQLKLKIKGSYKSVVHDYLDQMDLNAKSSVGSHIESAGEMIIEQLLDDTREDCREQSPVEDDGFISLYMGIMVKKADIVDKLAKGLAESNNLSQSEKDLVRKNEDKFRESAFKVFDQDKNTQNNSPQE